MLCMEASRLCHLFRESPELFPFISRCLRSPANLLLGQAPCYPALSILKIQVAIWFLLAFSLKIFPLILQGTFFSHPNLLLRNKQFVFQSCCFSCKFFFFNLFWKSKLNVDSFFFLLSFFLDASLDFP